MKRASREVERRRCCTVAVGAVAALLVTMATSTVTAEVLVVRADPERGLEPGDEVVGWSLLGALGETLARGAIEGPLHLQAVRTEQAPRGAFVLRLAAGGLSEAIETGDSLVVRPVLSSSQLRLYEQVNGGSGAAEAPREPIERAERYVQLAEALERERRPEAAAWALGGAAAASRDVETTRFHLSRAREIVADRPEFVTNLLRLEQRLLRDLRQPADPHRRELLERALELDRRHRPRSLTVARDLVELGGLDALGTRPDLAEERLLEARELFEAANPDSLYLAEVYYRLGLAVGAQGRRDEQLVWSRREVGLFERVGAEGPGRIRAMMALGSTLAQVGQVYSARNTLEETLRLAEADPKVPETQIASLANNLAVLLSNMGDLAGAEVHSLRAVDIARSDGTRPRNEAAALSTLATIYLERKQWDLADARTAEAIAIVERSSPRSRTHAVLLNNRANAASLAGRLDAARTYVSEAEEIVAEVAPESLTAAKSRIIRAQIARAEGDYATTIREATESLDQVRRDYPGTFRVGRFAMQLGNYLRESGDLDGARRVLEEAVEVFSIDDLGVVQHARALNGLGLVARDQGRMEEAVRLLCAAVDILDRQRLGFGIDRSGNAAFSRSMSRYYHECATAQLAAGDPEGAFSVVDRARSRDLLVMLAERRLGLDEDLTEETLALRDRLNKRYDDLYAVLLAEEAGRSELAPESDTVAGPRAGQPSPSSEERRAALDELRREQLELERRVRAERGELSLLPTEASAQEILAAIGPRSALLSYSIGGDASLLLLAAPGPESIPVVRAWSVPVGRRALGVAVRDFVGAIEARLDTDAPARTLWNDWIAPALETLESVDGLERLLIATDGPLHGLPFAALRDESGRYLVERWSVARVGSGAVLEELRRREPSMKTTVAAFADPARPETTADDRLGGRLGVAVRSGLQLGPLPAARREAEALGGLFSSDARLFFGQNASEANFKRVAPEARWLHVASHGFFDPRSPLDSGLVLAPSANDGQNDNGFLQAWEIFEEVRLDADLVTLSACESGRGEDAGVEGVVGLTRALQVAGARSVVASLWKVTDESTADLMIDFYRSLASGLSKDQALRAAQLAALRCCEEASSAKSDDTTRAVGGLAARTGVDRRHPASWSAFVLFGDWR